MVPTSFASALMASLSHTLRTRVVMFGDSLARVASVSLLMSVAHTLAPLRAKASAVARPIPWPEAVATMVLPASLSVIACFLPQRHPARSRFPAHIIDGTRGWRLCTGLSTPLAPRYDPARAACTLA